MSEEIEIRRLGETDAPLVMASDAFDNAAIAEQTTAFLADDGHEIVAAISAGEIIGFASGAVLLHPDKAPALFISEVGVNEEFRRRGVGARLVDQLLNLARARGCKGVWVATEGDNDAARALYSKLDSRETKDIVVYDWDGAMD